MINNNKKIITMAGLMSPVLLAVVGFIPTFSYAIESLTEDELSYVSGQDGLGIDLSSGANGISAIQLNISMDAATSDAATLSAVGISLQGYDALGNVNGAPVHSSLGLDFGATSAAGNPGVQVVYVLDRSRLRIDDLKLSSSAVRSYGTTILDGSGSVVLRNTGPFDAVNTSAYLKGQLDNASLFYQPLWSGHPYLTLSRLDALWEIPAGSVGVTSGGIKMSTIGTSSPLINVKLDFDVLYKFPALYPGEEFKLTANDRPLMHFGWIGSLKNAELIWMAGGAWSTYSVASKSQGLSFSSKWDFVSYADANDTVPTLHNGIMSLGLNAPGKEFRWQLGEAASGDPADRSRVNFELSDWATWSPTVNANAHSFPLIALDVINGASTTWKGQLCFGSSQNAATCAAGSQPIDLALGDIAGYSAAVNRTGDSALSLLVSKGQLMSFSRKIKVLETNAAGVSSTTGSYNWGLIYTLANIDAGIYLYAGGSEGDTANGSRNRGIMADILLMSQSLATACDNNSAAACAQAFNWDKGSHFMIADTDVDKDGITGETRDAMGIGLVSSSFLLATNDARIWLKQMKSSSAQVGLADDPYLSGLDVMSPQARINVKGTFGGGVLPPNGATTETIRGGFINLNIEGMVNFRLSPSMASALNGKNFLGYSAAIRLMDTNIAKFSEATTGAGDNYQVVPNADDGSFLSISEPSNAAADFRLANVSGDIALTDGRMDLRGSTESGGGGKPQLKISNTILIGSASSARMDDAVIGSSLPAFASGSSASGRQLDGRVEFGDLKLGRIVIPNAQLYSSITLKPQ